MKSTAPPHGGHKTFNQLGITLIVISSGLLGIWAVRDTIALRNILLVLGSILSLIYWYIYFKNQKKLSFPDFKDKPFIDFLPTVLIGCMFLWVVLHYFFFSRFPQQQWDELTSMWLRSFLACLIGSATAMAFRGKSQSLWFLWFGLLISFMVLFYQYIPKAIEKNSLFAPDFFGGYIYWAKFNGVLAGSILVAGALGYYLDRLSFDNWLFGEIEDWRLSVFLTFYLLISLFLPIYSFVYIFDARNGIGISALLFLIFIFFLFFFNITNVSNFKVSNLTILVKKLFIFIILIFLFSFLFIQHDKFNTGWRTIVKDATLAVQIDQYQNWKNLPELGYPKHEDGKNVSINTYERVAFARVGLRLLAYDPFGIGILRSLPVQMKEVGIDFSYHAYTHSAWIDLGLAYGIVGMLIPITILFLLLAQNFFKKELPNKNLLIFLIINFFVLYFIGEYAFQHGIEILFFFIAFISCASFFNSTH
jgi:hypothetical protein